MQSSKYIDFPTISINSADYKAEGRSYFLT